MRYERSGLRISFVVNYRISKGEKRNFSLGFARRVGESGMKDYAKKSWSGSQTAPESKACAGWVKSECR